MGRPVKSLVEHMLHGTKPQSKALSESHVRAGRPKFPSDIRKDHVLRGVFKNIVKLLGERRSLSEGDVELIRLYVFVYDRHKRNVDLLRHEGEVVEYEVLDSNGHPTKRFKENVRVKLCTAAEKQMASILSQLGLSPTAKDRAKPTSGPQKEQLPPNSIGALHPELFASKVTPIAAYVSPLPPGIEEEDDDATMD